MMQRAIVVCPPGDIVFAVSEMFPKFKIIKLHFSIQKKLHIFLYFFIFINQNPLGTRLNLCISRISESKFCQIWWCIEFNILFFEEGKCSSYNLNT